MNRYRQAIHPSGFPWVWVYTEREELFWDTGATTRSRDCTVCRSESHWRYAGPKGWARHPQCGMTTFTVASRETYLDALYDVAAVFPGMEQVVTKPITDARVELVLGNPQAGCEVCGRPYAALWLAARTWRCPLHPPGKSAYYRGNR